MHKSKTKAVVMFKKINKQKNKLNEIDTMSAAILMRVKQRIACVISIV